MIIFIVDMIQIHRCLPFVSCFPSVYACFVNFDKSWLFVCVCVSVCLRLFTAYGFLSHRIGVQDFAVLAQELVLGCTRETHRLRFSRDRGPGDR